MSRIMAILATNGVEECQLLEPRRALEVAGFRSLVVSPESGTILAMKQNVKPASQIVVDATIGEAAGMAFDGILLPGGIINSDTLRMNEAAVAFLRGFVSERKLIASICHAPWTLIEAGGVKGRTLTSWPSLQTDLLNAGADWVDQEMCVDDNLVSSRCSDDLPVFSTALTVQYRDRPA